MALFKIEYDSEKDKVVKTLTFRGKEYIEVYKNQGTSCDCSIEYQIHKAYLKLDNVTTEIIETVVNKTAQCDIRLMELVEELSKLEKSEIQKGANHEQID